MPPAKVKVKYKGTRAYPFYIRWLMTAEIKFSKLSPKGEQYLENCKHFDIIDINRDKTIVEALVSEDKNISEQIYLFKIAISKCVEKEEETNINFEKVLSPTFTKMMSQMDFVEEFTRKKPNFKIQKQKKTETNEQDKYIKSLFENKTKPKKKKSKKQINRINNSSQINQQIDNDNLINSFFGA